MLSEVVAPYAQATLLFVDMTRYLATVDKEVFYVNDHFTIEAYFRAFIPDILKDSDKAIYIDGDTVVLEDIGCLFEIDVGNAWLGASKDYAVQISGLVNDEVKAYFERIQLPDLASYFQSGILIFNLKELRVNKVVALFFGRLKEIASPILWVDQDIFNLIAHQHIFFFSPRWNVTVKALDRRNVTHPIGRKLYEMWYNDCFLHPKILHFCGNTWQDKTIKESRIFWKYVRQIPKPFRKKLTERLSQKRDRVRKMRLYRAIYKFSFGKLRKEYKAKYKKLLNGC